MKPPRIKLSHDARILFFALAGGFPAVLACVILQLVAGYSAREQWTVDLLVGLCWLGFCFARGGPVAYTCQSTGSNAGRGLLDPRSSRGPQRADGRSHAAGERHGRDAAGPAARSARSHRSATQSDGRDRCSRVRVRPSAVATIGEPGGRENVGPACRTPVGARCNIPRIGGVSGGRAGADDSTLVSRRDRPVGNPAQPVPRRRRTAPVASRLGFDAPFTRGGTASVAAPGSGHWARIE